MLINSNIKLHYINNEDTTMQERFCDCGARILVQFMFHGTRWETIFWGKSQFNGNRLYICPSCGQFLNIDFLH